jgi:hypothetical protein
MFDQATENILESITDEFFALDRQWRYTYINERALDRVRALKGEELTCEVLLGKNLWELYPEAWALCSIRSTAKPCAGRSPSISKRTRR